MTLNYWKARWQEVTRCGHLFAASCIQLHRYLCPRRNSSLAGMFVAIWLLSNFLSSASSTSMWLLTLISTLPNLPSTTSMNRPSTPPAPQPVRLRLVKGHRLVISIDDSSIDKVDVTCGEYGPSPSKLVCPMFTSMVFRMLTLSLEHAIGFTIRRCPTPCGDSRVAARGRYPFPHTSYHCLTHSPRSTASNTTTMLHLAP